MSDELFYVILGRHLKQVPVCNYFPRTALTIAVPFKPYFWFAPFLKSEAGVAVCSAVDCS